MSLSSPILYATILNIIFLMRIHAIYGRNPKSKLLAVSTSNRSSYHISVLALLIFLFISV